MLTNTLSLVGTTVVTSGLGLAYWWIAARQYTPDAVGFASAAIATMVLLGSICMLGLGTLLITELPRQPEKRVSLISTGILVVAVVGAVVGAGFALISPFFSAQFAPLRVNALDVLIFAIGVSFTSAAAVLDQSLIGILRGNVQFSRNALFALSKLLLLIVIGVCLSLKTGMTIYTSWAAGIVFSFLAVFIYSLLKKGWQGKAYLPQWNLLRKLGVAALQHHMLNLTLQVPTQILPILVTTLLSVKMNAWFYVSWLIASFLFLVPMSFTSVLHAMSSAEQSTLKQKARTTMGVSFLFCLLAGSVLFIGAKQVLGLFGNAYADQAAWCLRILVLAGFTLAIRAHYISFCRIQDRVGRAMFGTASGGILEIGGAILGAHLGSLPGLCMGWVIATAVEAAFMSPVIYKVLWPARGAVEELLPENFGEAEPVWLFDTIMMAAVPPRHTTGYLRAVTGQMRVMAPPPARPSEPGWQTNSVVQPVLPPSHLALMQMPTTPLPVGEQTGKAIWDSETSICPAIPPDVAGKPRVRKIRLKREEEA